MYLSSLYGTKAIACGDHGRLYASVSTPAGETAPHFVVVDPVGTDGFLDSVSPAVDFSAHAIVYTNGALYVLAPKMTGESPGVLTFLHEVTLDGKLVRSFGVPPVSYGNLTLGLLTRGALLWSERDDSLVFISNSPYEFQFYGKADGVLLRTWKRSDPNFRRIAPLFGSGRLNIKDYVSNAVRLPGAGYATFVIKGPGPSRTYTDGYLEILDLNLNVVASPVLLGTAFGILAGAASDTELYFLRNTRLEGANVVKGSLQPEQ